MAHEKKSHTESLVIWCIFDGLEFVVDLILPDYLLFEKKTISFFFLIFS